MNGFLKRQDKFTEEKAGHGQEIKGNINLGLSSLSSEDYANVHTQFSPCLGVLSFVDLHEQVLMETELLQLDLGSFFIFQCN